MNHVEPLESRLQFDGGDLDTTFGDDGAVTIDYRALLGDDGWRSAGTHFTQDTGGRIYVTSKQRHFADDNFTLLEEKIVIRRFSRDGQLDSEFGGGGYKLLDRNPATAGLFTNYPVETFLDANNRTHVLDGGILWRLTPGGRADMTFGRRGKVAVPSLLTSTTTLPQDVAFDADGRTYIAGTAQGQTGTRMAVVRLDQSGAWDTAWGYQSPVPVPGTQSRATLLRFLPSGQLIVAGSSDVGTTSAGWVTRLNADGAVDTTYGDAGYAREEFDTQSSAANPTAAPAAIASDGAVYGYTQITTDNPDPQAAYGGWNWLISRDGVAIEPFPVVPPGWAALYDTELVTQMTVQPDGKILARGGPEQNNLFRVDATGTGTLDPTWGADGIVSGAGAGIGNTPDAGPAAVAPDGSILTQGGDFDADIVKLYRLFRDDAPLAQFDGRQLIRPRTTATRFSVTYRDDDGVDEASIDSADVRVFGPFDGAPRSRSATLEAVEDLGDNRYRATYKLTSPGGWTAADNGTYTVRLISGEVTDINGVAAAATALGTFRVRIR